MTHRVLLSRGAVRALHKLDPPARRRVQAVLDLLAETPRPPGARKLSGGSGEWRVRSGDYRVVYDIDDGVLTILVVAVGPAGHLSAIAGAGLDSAGWLPRTVLWMRAGPHANRSS